jgi:formate dehydrogenase accessory protein FdhE
MARAPAIDPRWAARARRALALGHDRPHSEALLRFYLSLLELQTKVGHLTDVDSLMATVASGGDPDPALRLERLRVAPLATGFLEFCRGMPSAAPPPVVAAARAAAEAAAAVRTRLLEALLTTADLEATADKLGCSTAPLTFLARGFLSPVAEQLAARAVVPAGTRSPTCPACGWPPQVSKLEDEEGAEGNRRLVCAFCATEWAFPRSVCAACGATGDEGLEFHADEQLTHVRVEACRSCHTYLKAVDRRVFGFAEPLVEDLATPELDLWAAEQGLRKTVPNLLGL